MPTRRGRWPGSGRATRRRATASVIAWRCCWRTGRSSSSTIWRSTGLARASCPINPDYRHDEVAYLLGHSEAELAVVLPHRVADVGSAAAACAQAARGRRCTRAACRTAAPRGVGARGEPSLDTECALLYTSGTTGRPKGCMLSNFYFLTSGRTYCSLGGLIKLRHGQERFYNPLPLYHMNHLALTATAAMLTANALVLPERFSPTRWWPEVSATGATIVHYLGVVAPMLLNQPPGPADRAHGCALRRSAPASSRSCTGPSRSASASP